MQDVGVDLGDPVLMSTRSWAWLRARILGLLTRPQPVVVVGERVIGQPVNRLQAAFTSYDAEQHRDAEEG